MLGYEPPTTMPPEFIAACKCVPIDSDWPISDGVHALHLLYEWEEREHLPRRHLSEHIMGITHSHSKEIDDLNRYGYDNVYKYSIWTKYVSIAWHLAGRYEYDIGFIAHLEQLGFIRPTNPVNMLELGSAPWIQAIFYANKGIDVTVTNADYESDCNRFGRFLAEKSGFVEAESSAGRRYWSKARAGSLREDSTWDKYTYDIVYCIDVLEHIAPLPDGSPGWIPVAEKMYTALKPGGLWYVNAPLGKDTTCHPVEHHVVHWTSPISHEEWALAKGLRPMNVSCCWEKP